MRVVAKILQLGFFLILAIVVLLAVFTKVSPNLHFIAIKTGGQKDIHYLVIDITTGKSFKTHAEYPTDNDVKAAGFSSDSTKFAAAYHYRSGLSYTWIGVWETKTEKFLWFVKKNGWTTDLSGVFDK